MRLGASHHLRLQCSIQCWHGRRPEDHHIALAWEIAAEPLHFRTEQYVRWGSEAADRPVMDEALKHLVSVDEMIARQSFDFLGEPAIVGTPQDAIEMIEEYRTRGRMTHFVCYFPTSGMAPHLIRDGMTLFAREVMPHFR